MPAITKLVFASATLMAVVFATAQGSPGAGLKNQPKQQPPAVQQPAPVTFKEVNQVIDKLEGSLKAILKNTAPPKNTRTTTDAPATRDYIVREFTRLFEWARPNFKMTPRMIKVDPKRFVVKQESVKSLERLVSWGFVPGVSVLAVGPEDSMRPREFGDSLGYFVARMAELTHTPDPKYTPFMMDRIN